MSLIDKGKVKIEVVIPEEKQYGSGKILGEKMFAEPYCNIFLCARKKSGKTTIIYNILKKCANKDTTVLFFVSTINKDPTYAKIKQMLDDRDIQHLDYMHFIDDNKSNILEEFIRELGQADEEEENKVLGEVPKEYSKVLFGGERSIAEIEAESKKKSKKGKRVVVPEYIFVFDDLGNDLRNKSVSQLLKKNRHYKSKVILSSQYLHDLDPQSYRQLDYALLFSGLTEEKIEHIYKLLDLSIDLMEFAELYLKATEKKYSFLYIDVAKEEFRRNFG